MKRVWAVFALLLLGFVVSVSAADYTLHDQSLNGFNLSSRNVTYNVTDSSFKFNGSAVSGLWVADSSRFDTNVSTISIAFWHKNGAPFQGFVEKGGTWRLALTGGSQLRCSFATTSVAWTGRIASSPAVIADGYWHHSVCVYNGSHVNAYLDGVLVNSSGNVSGQLLDTAGNVCIGDLCGSNALSGSMRDVKIYVNTSLTSSQVYKLYQNGITSCSSLTAWWATVNSTYGGCSDTNTNVVVNWTQNVANVSATFYGANSEGWGSNLSYVDANNDGAHDTLSNYTWHRQMMSSAGLKHLRQTMYLNTIYYQNRTFKDYGTANVNINTLRDDVTMARTLGIKITWIAAYMPSWLADTTQGCSSANWTCPPSNMTQWTNGVTDFLNATGCDSTVCEVEVWNGPDLTGFWMKDTASSAANRTTKYVSLYNATYDAIKLAYPNMSVFGAAIDGDLVPLGVDQKAMQYALMSSLPTKTDANSFHIYQQSGDMDNFIQQHMDILNQFCTTTGANCSRIVISEWENKNATQQVNESTSSYRLSQGLLYNYFLTKAPSITTLNLFQWMEYTNYSAYTPLYPNRYAMLSEPQLNNQIYEGYSLMRNLTQRAPAGGKLYNVTQNNLNLIVTGSINNGIYSIIVTNKGLTNTTFNVSQPNSTNIIGLYSVYENVTYNTTPSSTVVSNVNVPAGTLQIYDFLLNSTFNDTVPPSLTLGGPLNLSVDVDGTLNFTFAPSDEYGISTCSLIVNGSAYATINATNATVNNFTFTNVTGALLGNPILWSINCTDNAGNTNSTETRQLVTGNVVSGTGNALSLLNNLTVAANFTLNVSTGGIVPSSSVLTFPNGSSQNLSYSFDLTSGLISFTSQLPPGASYLTLITTSPAGETCSVLLSSAERNIMVIAIIAGLLFFVATMFMGGDYKTIILSVIAAVVAMILFSGVINSLCVGA